MKKRGRDRKEGEESVRHHVANLPIAQQQVSAGGEAL